MMQKTILSVEDYDDSCEMMRFFLEDRGFRVVEAESGRDAMSIWKQIR